MRIGRAILWTFGWSMLLTRLPAQAPVATPVGPHCVQHPLLRIGLIADAQYCDCDADKGRFYRISLEKLHQSVDTLNAHAVDFVVNLGDLVDQKLASYPLAMRELSRLQMPVHHLLGNHEFWDVPFQLQRTVLDTLDLQSSYCELQFPGWRLLMLDGTELAEYAQGAHRDLVDEAEACRNSLLGHTNQAPWNGAIGGAQMAWIERQLDEAEAANERVILFCHFPISPAGHPMTLWNETDLRVLLGRHRSPEAWVAGHSHGGDYHLLEGVHHLTLTGMLMTPDSNAFAILNVYDDRLVLEGFGREPARVMPLRGSSALPDTLLPRVVARADALPPREQICIERSFVSPAGFTVFSEETDSLGAANLPRLRPGVYGIRSQSHGQFQFRHVVILPR
jgi:manganese-dependent ADP-ribose/CDP-alcohol diphosphatase